MSFLIIYILFKFDINLKNKTQIKVLNYCKFNQKEKMAARWSMKTVEQEYKPNTGDKMKMVMR